MQDFIIYGSCFVSGLIIGFILQIIKPKSGVLKIDKNNPEKDIYRIEIDNLDDLSKKKSITLKVDSKATLTRD